MRLLQANGLMEWRIGPDGSAWGSNAASDADQDMAMALLMGCKKFGDSNMCLEGESLIRRLMLYEVENATDALKPGDTWGGCAAKSPVFNPSYFAPASYRRVLVLTRTCPRTWKVRKV